MDGTCEHADVCRRDALKGHDDKCILHSENWEKDEEAFEEALEEHREEYGTDFRYMTFPNGVDFSEETFDTKVNFFQATIFGESNFKNTTFKHNVNFADSDFFGKSCFNKCEFLEAVKFGIWEEADRLIDLGAHFLDIADFSNSIFSGGASFQKVKFDEDVKFRNSEFSKVAYFKETCFRGEAEFAFSDFKGPAYFIGTTFKERTYFTGSNFDELCFQPVRGDEPVTFAKKMDFQQCEIRSSAILAGKNKDERVLDGIEVNFTGVEIHSEASLRFRYADLSQARFIRTDLQDVQFTGVEWNEAVSDDEVFSRRGLYEEVAEKSWSGTRWVEGDPGDSIETPNWKEERQERPWSEIERLYRQLKRNYEERGDFPRAGDFHIGEKEARRQNPQTHRGMWLLVIAYRALSKYGERALPAALWLVVLVFGFALIYYLSGATTLATAGAVTYPEAFIHSLEATFYPVQSVGFQNFGPQLFSIVQRVISPVLIALLALALRQRVKR